MPWASVPVVDKVNHLAVVMIKDGWVVIHTTEGSRRDAIKKALREGRLGPLELIRPGHLKAAFMKGHARTLWMRGTHRPTAYKADTKVLGGPDLVPALDPLGDQSYRYTAARCEPGNQGIGDVMGLAVDQSRIWIGPSERWEDFQDTLIATLNALEETDGADEEPLPVLASASTDLSDVSGAYDIAISPPEMLMMGPVLDSAEAATLAEMEQLAFGTQFEVTRADGLTAAATVFRRGQVLGTLELELAEGMNGIETKISGDAEPGREADLQEILNKLNEPEILTIYFESGHTIQSNQAFNVRHRDIPFAGWRWVDFGADWTVDREKPQAGVSTIGTDNSLFDWMLANWPLDKDTVEARGWLACDDRPGETADFLHIDESGSVPVLSLVHVKGAKNANPDRGIAVVPYETVCAQAIKNLRHLDALLAAETLLAGTIPSDLELAAWQGGQTRSRAQFLGRLEELGTNFGRRVVVVQPHVRETLVDAIRLDGDHVQLPRLRQLDTLLHGVAADCQSAGADFVVVGST